MTWGAVSLQLPVKYPQLPDILIGQNGTLIWGYTETPHRRAERGETDERAHEYLLVF